MKAFLIDPHAKEVTEIDIKDGRELLERIGETVLKYKDFLGDRVFTGNNAFVAASRGHDTQAFFMGPENRIYAGLGVVIGIAERSTIIDGIEYFLDDSKLGLEEVQAAVKFKWSHEL